MKHNSSKVQNEKNTSVSSSPHQGLKCPVKEAVKFLAGAWTLEIYWYLKEQDLRFGELKRNLQGVSPKVLTQRLRDLEDLGVVHREILETYPPQVQYSLTVFGKKFLPIIEMIADVGQSLVRKSRKN